MPVEAWGLEGRNLVALYGVQAAFGTAVTPNKSLGLVSYEMGIPAGTRAIFGLGSPDALFLKPGISIPRIRIQNILVQDVVLFSDICARTSGVLPWLTIALGYVDDDGTGWARQIQDCKVGEWDVRLEGSESEEAGLLVANMGFTGRINSEPTDLTQIQLADSPLAHYEAILTKGGAAYESDVFALSVNENLRTKTPIPGAAPTSDEARIVKYIKEGKRDVSGEISRAAHSAVNLQADVLTAFAINLALTDAAGGSAPNAIAFAIAGALFNEETMRGGPDQELAFSTPFTATTVAIS